jgi:selenocysteine-specific elongation factor
VVVAALTTLASGAPDEIALQAIERRPRTLRELHVELDGSLPRKEQIAALTRLLESGQLTCLPFAENATPLQADLLVATARLRELESALVTALERFHAANPMRKGMAKEDLRNRLGLAGSARLFDELLSHAGRSQMALTERATVRLPGHRVSLDVERSKAADRLLAALRESPYSPPAPAEFGVDAETLGALEELGEIARISDDLVYDPATFRHIQAEVLRIIEQEGTMTIATYRDHFGTSRKYAQATLEYLDQRQITKRVGDARVRFAGVGAARPVEETG